MPTLVVTNFNIVCSVLGGFITVFGLVSYLFKEKFYLSEACTFSPYLGTFLCCWFGQWRGIIVEYRFGHSSRT